MRIHQSVAAYIEDRNLSARLRPNSVRLYTFYLRRFLSFMKLKRRLNAEELTRVDVLGFLAWMRESSIIERHKELSKSAEDKAYDCVRAWCRWACDEGQLGRNPFRSLKPPVVPRKPRQIATGDQVRAFLDFLQGLAKRVGTARGPGRLSGKLHPVYGGKRLQPNPRGYVDRRLILRDAAVYACDYFAALRISEACPVLLEDLELERGFLVVRNAKGGQPRVVPIHVDLARILRRWLRARAEILADAGCSSRYLFIAMPGRWVRRQVDARHVDSSRMQRLLRERYLPAFKHSRFSKDFPRIFTPHVFRHSVITNLLNLGAPLADVQELAGHLSPQTTLLYRHSAPAHLRPTVARA